MSFIIDAEGQSVARSDVAAVRPARVRGSARSRLRPAPPKAPAASAGGVVGSEVGGLRPLRGRAASSSGDVDRGTSAGPPPSRAGARPGSVRANGRCSGSRPRAAVRRRWAWHRGYGLRVPAVARPAACAPTRVRRREPVAAPRAGAGVARASVRGLVVEVDLDRPLHLVLRLAELAQTPPDRPSESGQALRPDHDQGDDEDDQELLRTDVQHLALRSRWGSRWAPVGNPGAEGPREGPSYCRLGSADRTSGPGAGGASGRRRCRRARRSPASGARPRPGSGPPPGRARTGAGSGRSVRRAPRRATGARRRARRARSWSSRVDASGGAGRRGYCAARNCSM